MLRDGYFIKEDPPKIGSHYSPLSKPTEYTKEEQFVQNVLLGIHERKESFLSKVFGFLLRM